MTKPIAIFAGYFVRYPLGGHVLAEIQKLIGLHRLGYRVIFVEDAGAGWNPCFNPERGEMTADPTYGIRVLQDTLRPHGLETNWCYVDSKRHYHGIAAADLTDLCRQATLLFSRAGTTWLDEFRECHTRIYVDVDPAFTQFQMPATPHPSVSGYASPYDFQHHFTLGTRIGKPDCLVPTHGLHWQPTRPPVVLDLFAPRFTPHAKLFTSIMNWRSFGDATYQGESYGHKDVEFLRFVDIPKRVGHIFEIAISGAATPTERLQAAGWKLSRAGTLTRSVENYLDFIGNSRGEFSVAKNGYIKTRCGWFSDRTAAYLALGKPAIVQDTGFSEELPCGEGLFAFETADDIAAAVEEIARDYPRHCRAARRIAEEYFDAEKVLGKLLRACDLPAGG